jgi:two-component system sensor histidine kinase QseC
MQALDPYALAQAVISELYEDIDARKQTISLEGTHHTINGDEASLRLLLANLIQNASKYSPQGADITVAVNEEEFGVALQVIDTGPGIPLADLGRVLDRFYRVGGDRHSSASEGCGLGLSIARHIADLHHANLKLTNNDPGPGLTASVFFPYYSPGDDKGRH